MVGDLLPLLDGFFELDGLLLLIELERVFIEGGLVAVDLLLIRTHMDTW